MTIKVYTNIQDMTGIGEEWLVDDKENVRAVFYEGNMVCQVVRIYPKSDEKTRGVQNG